jgi:hypothetical protein
VFEPQAEFWTANAHSLQAYEDALDMIVDILVEHVGKVRIVQLILAEPDSSHLAPAVDAYRVNPDRLAAALSALFHLYRDLPSPPGTNPHTKFTTLPPRLRSLQRGVLDQCYRVWYSRRHTLAEPVRTQLYQLICGHPTAPPGMEDYMTRYERIHSADFAREDPATFASMTNRRRPWWRFW